MSVWLFLYLNQAPPPMVACLLLLMLLLLQMGDIGNAGKCTRACGGCTICAAGNKACYNENRRKAGFLVYEEDDLDSDRVLGNTSASTDQTS
jgi:hypothetical protein